MPQASPDMVDRIAGVLANGGFAEKRDLLRTTPIGPPDGKATMFDAERVSGSLDKWQKLKITENKDMICFIRFMPDTKDLIGAVPPLQPGETTEMMWRRLIGRASTAKYVGGVGKTDYVAELNDPGITDDKDRFKHRFSRSTRRAADLEELLAARKSLSRVTVSPWGAVFGLRDDAGNWTLTLVQNARVTYMRLVETVTKRFLMKKTRIKEQGEDTDPTTFISHCYNLGHKDFFPGMGTVQVRHVDTDQIF